MHDGARQSGDNRFPNPALDAHWAAHRHRAHNFDLSQSDARKNEQSLHGETNVMLSRRSVLYSTSALVLAYLALLIGAASTPAIADERTINAIGHGVEPCKAWLEARKDGYSAGYGDWLLGYLTGVNLWGPTSGRDLLRKDQLAGGRFDDFVWKHGAVTAGFYGKIALQFRIF
jgi:hypothetical protein